MIYSILTKYRECKEDTSYNTMAKFSRLDCAKDFIISRREWFVEQDADIVLGVNDNGNVGFIKCAPDLVGIGDSFVMMTDAFWEKVRTEDADYIDEMIEIYNHLR